MARPLYASFLPTIKCSSCGIEIEISGMGDHLCRGASEGADENLNSARTDHDRIPASTLKPPEAGALAPPTFTNRTLAQSPAAPHANGIDREQAAVESRQTSAPPSIAVLQPESSPSPPPGDGNTGSPPSLMGPRKPSSEMALPQDSPFPIFPTRKAIARPQVPNRLDLEDSRNTSNTSPPLATGPLSPQPSSGATVLRRMNTIAPGPFNSRGKREVDKVNPRSPTSSTFPSHAEVESSNPASQTSNQPPQRPPRPKTDDSLVERLQDSAVGNLQTDFFVPPLPPQPPSNSSLEQTQSIPTANVDSTTSSPETLPPLPNFSQTSATQPNNRGHSITESDSSTGSPSMSEYRSTSSRSSESPIVSNVSSEFRQKPAVDVIGDQSIQSVLERNPSAEKVVAPQESRGNSPVINQHQNDRSVSTSAAQQPEGLIQTSQDGPSVMQESPTVWSSPTSQQFLDGEQRLSSLRYDPTASNGKAAGPDIDLQQKPSVRKTRIKAKGACRGCGTPIVGKSLKAADGRLSGRWHKECFVCKTCQSRFQTADFYVLNDQPYCAQHYHELNQSLCQQCNSGIEGKYLETQPSRKYHLDCFTCKDCRKPLTRDYFEINGSFYCEADAYRVWQKSKMLTPGRRFPERRTTKLMNTS